MLNMADVQVMHYQNIWDTKMKQRLYRKPIFYSLIIASILLFLKPIQTTAAIISSDIYTYSDMKQELEQISDEYGSWTELLNLGKTYDERDILCLKIGKDTAHHKILITGSIHAREYITTELVMYQVKSFLSSLKNEAIYKGITYPDLLSGCTIYVIPMVNPDGVTISQFGTSGLNTSKAKENVYRIYEMDGAIEIEPYLIQWKSNAEGIDLNRNFDALWEQYDDHLNHPSSDHYKGPSPGCCPESAALINLTQKEGFERTISYHSQGEVIYWYFGQDGELLNQTKRFANRISAITGYRMDSNYHNLDPAGYKDWAISKMHIPSLTIEVGTGKNPVDHNQFGRICEQNKYVWEETLLDYNYN